MRHVPSALQSHLDGNATTTTRILKISLKDGRVFGLSMLDQDVTYDDGASGGEVVYVASNGFDASTFAADLGYSIANAEGYALISQDVPGIDVEDVDSGALDDAEWVCYLVNFEDLTSGNHMIIDAGDLGTVRSRFGMVWMPEFLSYLMRLKQPIGSVWSRTCRAVFGSPADSQTGCGVDLDPLWVLGEIVTPGSEANRTFTGDVVTAGSPSDVMVPGVVQFLTGDNAGKEFAVEAVDGLTVELLETTPFPMLAGDTYRIRPDCAKRYVEDCVHRWNNGPNFKGEPLIPTGDGTSVLVPGAQLGGVEWKG